MKACAEEQIAAAALAALRKAQEVRHREGLSADAVEAVALDEARRSACPSLFWPVLNFGDDKILLVLADGLARWAVAASAVAPDADMFVPPWPTLVPEDRPMH
ncbi:hypothetical protein AAFN86_11630 [Roseomonas sp. CAU 1739]|uniref:hypothetical protein n=1 Tax=Roseomonas sp. CAU 1739 TaxID=3140364 RepID=UPI00325A6068